MPEFTLLSGSSPRVWGIHSPYQLCRLSVRFIPTRVGNTPSPCALPVRCAVHPHACGEYVYNQAVKMASDGSSPRVWGIRNHVNFPAVLCRFIPTRVGNTSERATELTTYPVHPHACGEYDAIRDGIREAFGSSPRVWGILANSKPNLYVFRFIPTRVGNTQPIYERLRRHIGSSPRVWGILSPSPRAVSMRRFIPTRVGNTRAHLGGSAVNTVHPHACGEYAALFCDKLSGVGSSPRVWGIRLEGFKFPQGCRFIPTRVGNTIGAASMPAQASVHPHACGEYSSGRCKK